MSVSLNRKPFNATGLRTGGRPHPDFGTRPAGTAPAAICMLLFLLASAATLTIWMDDPRLGWGYQMCAFALAAWTLVTLPEAGPRRRVAGPGAAAKRPGLAWTFLSGGWLAGGRRSGLRLCPLGLAVMALWGWLELATGHTVYCWATLNAALEMTALAGTAGVAYSTLDSPRLRRWFLPALAWSGGLLSIVAMLAYYTSPGRVWWVFTSPYPDVWGPFLSRNNFAQFLELALPASLWLWLTAEREPRRMLYGALAASMLAGGLASASRAGAVLLAAEALVALPIAQRWESRGPGRPNRGTRGRRLLRPAAALLAVAVTLGAAAGASTLLERLRDPEPFAYRAEVYAAAADMIAGRPVWGYGLGNFATAYPQFARFDSGYRVEHAHSDWLEWAAEGGVPFALAWAAAVLGLLRPAAGSVWGLGVLAVAVHATVDFPFARQGIAVWVFILGGALERNRRDPALTILEA